MELEKQYGSLEQTGYKVQFETPSEMFKLPSKGLFYPEIDGKKIDEVRIYDLVTADENILMSTTLRQNGEFINELLRKKVVSPYPVEKFTIGDRLAIIIYLRATMEQIYNLKLIDPNTGVNFEYPLDLMSLNTKEIKHLPDQNGHFEYLLPKAQRLVKFKLLTGEAEKIIMQKKEKEEVMTGKESSTNLYRLEQQIISIEGIDDPFEKQRFIKNLNIMDGRRLIAFMEECMPSLDLNYEVTAPSGATFQTEIYLSSRFFNPEL